MPNKSTLKPITELDTTIPQPTNSSHLWDDLSQYEQGHLTSHHLRTIPELIRSLQMLAEDRKQPCPICKALSTRLNLL